MSLVIVLLMIRNDVINIHHYWLTSLWRTWLCHHYSWTVLIFMISVIWEHVTIHKQHEYSWWVCGCRGHCHARLVLLRIAWRMFTTNHSSVCRWAHDSITLTRCIIYLSVFSTCRVIGYKDSSYLSMFSTCPEWLARMTPRISLCSVLAQWLARKTPPRKPNRGEGIISTKPRLKSVYSINEEHFLGSTSISLVYCIVSLHYDMFMLSSALRDIFRTLWHDVAYLCWNTNQQSNFLYVEVQCLCRQTVERGLVTGMGLELFHSLLSVTI